MDKQSYFYQFFEPLSKELALVARELENSIFTSPRTMLTHARVFVENILQQVIRAEELPEDPRANLNDQLDMLNEKGYLIPEIRDALHFVRQIGNQAAHNSRRFRYSEALLSWEAVVPVVEESIRTKKWDSMFINVKLGKGNTVIRGESVPALWKEGLNWIEDHHLPVHEMIKEGVVLGSTDTGKRYAMALEPVHKDKRNFSQLHTYKSKLTGTTYYLETKINPKSGLETLAKLLTRLGVEVKIPLLESND